jgi:hypothetical protein
VLAPIVTRYRDRDPRRYFPGDAAFANPAIYEYLESEEAACHRERGMASRGTLPRVGFIMTNLRRTAKSVRHWTMTTLREKVIKMGAKVVSHARYIIFQLAWEISAHS